PTQSKLLNIHQNMAKTSKPFQTHSSPTLNNPENITPDNLFENNTHSENNTTQNNLPENDTHSENNTTQNNSVTNNTQPKNNTHSLKHKRSEEIIKPTSTKLTNTNGN
ncbi:9015_t:CDS:1, partial [Racocetra fulgida]